MLQIGTIDCISLSLSLALALSLWDGQCWIKCTWSLIMHSSVMQPSVATNLETESSPGLLSALLSIYGFPCIDESPRFPKALCCALMGWSCWVRIWTFTFCPGKPCFHTKPTRKVAAITAGKPNPSFVVCQTKCKLICQPKCAQLSILHV